MSAMRDKMVNDARRGYDAPVKNTGPLLDTSGERTRIVIPNLKRSAKLVKRMHTYGFTKHDSQWGRFTDQPLQGTRWSRKHWMELAEKCYQEAYGDTEVIKPVTKARVVAKKVGAYLQRDVETGLIRETSTLYKEKLFTEA